MLLGLTGGIATGKSSMAEELMRLRPEMRFFDADRCVHALLAADPEVLSEIREQFGPEAISSQGAADRKALSATVFSDATARRKLEAILHPRVRSEWRSQAEESKQAGVDFLADIPLLFETGAESYFDATVLVAASEVTQRARLAGRGVPSDAAEAMMRSQWPTSAKLERATAVAWNDGSRHALASQASLLLKTLFASQ